MFHNALKRIVLLFLFIILTIVLCVATLVVAREIMALIFVTGGVPATMIQPDDIERMRILGLRFDARSATLLSLPMILALVFFGGFKRTFKGTAKFIFGWSAFLFFLLPLLSVANAFYLEAFNNPLDLFIFNFLHEEPGAVMVTVWQDYPIVWGTLIVIAATATLTTLWRWLCQRITKTRLWERLTPIQTTALMLAAIFLITLFARGSLTSRYPLRRNNAQVSVVEQINNMVLNAPMAIYYAWSDFKKSTNFAPVTASKGQHWLKGAKLDSLYDTTPANAFLAKERPNVVLFVMESMGFNMMSYDQEHKTDLLGSLREHFKEDWVFRRFLSADLHTIQSLAPLLFLSPVTQISTSVVRDVPLAGTPFETYKKAGYRTVFVTSGTSVWENMGEYLPVQYVDDVYDQTHLMDHYGLSQTNEWGVADHYALDFAADIMTKSEDPVFVVVLSTANHPPYHVPAGYKPYPLTIPESIHRNYNTKSVDEKLPTIMMTYQSSCNALGNAISTIKKDSRREVVVAATADHRMLGMKPAAEDGPFKDKAVPFYLWASKGVKDNVATKFDALRVGAHKDIFPTLYHLSLSATKYFTVGGRNLLAVNDDTSRAFAYNKFLWADEKGAYTYGEHPQFHAWKKDASLLTEPQGTAADRAVMDRIYAYEHLDMWQINMRTKGFKDASQ